MNPEQPMRQVEDQKPKQSTKINLSFDLRIVVLLLVLVIAAMLVAWKPWSATASSEDEKRTITVTGESKVKAEPDEFVFDPTYGFKNTNKDAGLAELNKKSEEVIKKLKELGVADSKIKTNSSSYNYGYYYDSVSRQNNYSLQLTVTVGSREQAQKVQDYLITTGLQGSISPRANFSDAKKKELENQARNEATKDARAKADQSAKNLGFKIGKVKEIKDSNDNKFFGYYDRMTLESGAALDVARDNSLAVQPGEDDLSYNVTVVYYVK